MWLRLHLVASVLAFFGGRRHLHLRLRLLGCLFCVCCHVARVRCPCTCPCCRRHRCRRRWGWRCRGKWARWQKRAALRLLYVEDELALKLVSSDMCVASGWPISSVEYGQPLKTPKGCFDLSRKRVTIILLKTRLSLSFFESHYIIFIHYYLTHT